MAFHSIKPVQITENIFSLISKDWFLMSAEKEGRVNPMTVAWATAGILWQKPVVMCAVRPERYPGIPGRLRCLFTHSIRQQLPEDAWLLRDRFRP